MNGETIGIFIFLGIVALVAFLPGGFSLLNNSLAGLVWLVRKSAGWVIGAIIGLIIASFLFGR